MGLRLPRPSLGSTSPLDFARARLTTSRSGLAMTHVMVFMAFVTCLDSSVAKFTLSIVEGLPQNDRGYDTFHFDL